MTHLHDTGGPLPNSGLGIPVGRGEYDPRWLARAHKDLTVLSLRLAEADRRLAEAKRDMDSLAGTLGSEI